MKDIQNKIALITGSGSGLGEQIARTLAEAGSTVIVAGIQEDKLRKVTADIQNTGHRAEALVMDVSDEKSIRAGIGHVLSKYSRVDILVNNAGLDAEPKPIEGYTPEDFDHVIGVNLRGPFILCSTVLPSMYAANSGHIINIASTASLRTWPNASLYHISKVALRGLGWSLFTEIREKKSAVRVTTLIPGGMKTAHVTERFPDMDFSWMQDPKDVARIVQFVLLQPDKTEIPELTAIPPLEWSLP